MTQYYDDTAKDYAERAEAAAESASQSKQQASTAATTATTQANIATNAAQNAAVLVKSELENDVRAMKDAALSAASQASANAAAASGSAVDASHDAIDADQSRQAAQAAQTAAETAQTAAETAMGNASSSAGAAAASAQAAATSETNAAGSASAAATSESNAATSESNAETSAQNAATSEENAESSAKLSESWAKGDTGVRDDEDTNNAKYWADQSRSFSPITKADKVIGATAGDVAGLDAEGNLTDTGVHIDDVAQKDGYYEDMTVGRAENLIDPNAPATSRKFGFDTACGDISIDDNGNAIVRQFKGTTHVVNQLVKPYESVTSTGDGRVSTQYARGTAAESLTMQARSVVLNQGISIRTEVFTNNNVIATPEGNGVLHLTGTCTGTTGSSIVFGTMQVPRIVGHKYALYLGVTDIPVYGNWGTYHELANGSEVWTQTSTLNYQMSIRIDKDKVYDHHVRPQVVDLTEYFNYDQTLIDSITSWDDLVAYDSTFAQYVPYNTGEVKGLVPSVQVINGKNHMPYATGTTFEAAATNPDKFYKRITVKGLKPNTEYTMSVNNGYLDASGDSRMYLRNHTYGGSSDQFVKLNTVSGLRSVTESTASDGVLYVDINKAYLSAHADVLTNFQLEEGDVATTYTPYVDAGTYTAPQSLHGIVPFTSAASYARYDSYDAITGKFTQRIKSYTFTGQEEFVADTNNPGLFHIQNFLPDAFRVSGDKYDHVILPGYKASNSTSSVDLTVNLNSGSWSEGRFNIHDNSCTTVAQIQAKLAGKTLYYKLATPVVIDYSANDITLGVGVNTAFQTAGERAANLSLEHEATVYDIPLLSQSRYLYRHDGEDSIITYSANRPSLQVSYPDKLINLSVWFSRYNYGSVDYFYKLYPTWKYADIPYIEGKVISYKGTGVETIGFNAYDHTTRTAYLLGGNKYQICGTYTSVSYVDQWGNEETLELDADGIFTPENNGTLTVTGGNATDTCVHLCWSGYKNYGEPDYKWEPFTRNVRHFPVIAEQFPGGMHGFTDTDTLTQTEAVQNYGVYEIKGTENISLYYNGIQFNLASMKSGDRQKGACNILPPYGNGTTYNTTVANGAVVRFGAGASGKTVFLCGLLPFANVSSLTAIKQWLADKYAAGNPVILVYPLATPVATPLSEPPNLTYPVNDFGTERSLPVNTTELLSTDLDADIQYSIDFTRTVQHYSEIEKDVEALVADKDHIARDYGDYPEMGAGYARNLIDPNAPGVERLFSVDTSCGTASISDNGNGVIEEMMGRTINWNQYATNGDAHNGTAGWTNVIGQPVGEITADADTHVISYYFAGKCPYYISTVGGGLYKSAFNKPGHVIMVDWWMRTDSPIALTVNFSTSMIDTNTTTWYDGINMASNNGTILRSSDWTHVVAIRRILTSPNSNGASLYIANSGSVPNGITIQFRDCQVFDLTQMFGYGKEPRKIADFRALFPEPFYDYDPGTPMNYKGTGIKTVGFNQYKSTNEYIRVRPQAYQITGTYTSLNYSQWPLRTAPTALTLNQVTVFNTLYSYQNTYYTALVPIEDYSSSKTYKAGDICVHEGAWAQALVDITTAEEWDESHWTAIGAEALSLPKYFHSHAMPVDEDGVFTPPDFGWLYVSGGNDTDTCVHFTWSGYRNGDYEPYWESVRDIDVTQYFPDGMNGVQSNNTAGNTNYVCDELYNDKAVQRIYKKVFTGSETFSLMSPASGITNKMFQSAAFTNRDTTRGSAYDMFSNYLSVTLLTGSLSAEAKAIVNGGGVQWQASTTSYMYIVPPTTWGTITTVEAFKAKLKALYDADKPLIVWYILKTPVVTPINPAINLTYKVADFGTEAALPPAPASFPIDAVVKYSTDYMRELTHMIEDDVRGRVDKLDEQMANKADQNGDYREEGLIANAAGNLIDANATPVPAQFMFRPTAGDASVAAQGVAEMQACRGTTHTWNQLAEDYHANTMDVFGEGHVTDAKGGALESNVFQGETIVSNQLVPAYKEATASGTDSVQLPAAAAGDVHSLKVTGRTLVRNQLVTNGDFSNGTTGWAENIGFNTIAASGNVLTVTYTADGNSFVYTQLQLQAGHKYAVMFEARPSVSVEGLSVYIFNSQGASVNAADNYTAAAANTWTRKLVLFTAAYGDSNNLRIFARKIISGNDGIGTGGTLQIRNAMCVDLTQLFNGDTTLINSITSWDDLVALMPEYGQYVAKDAGTLVSRAGTITTGVWNQFAPPVSLDGTTQNPVWSAGGTGASITVHGVSSFTVSNQSDVGRIAYFLSTSTGNVTGHKILCHSYITADFVSSTYFYYVKGNLGYTTWTQGTRTLSEIVLSCDKFTSHSVGLMIPAGMTMKVEDLMFIDLTALCGAGNEPATVDAAKAYCASIGHPLTTYQAYDIGTPLGGTATYSGLNGVGSVQDEKDLVTGVRTQKVGSYTFTGEEAWAYNYIGQADRRYGFTLTGVFPGIKGVAWTSTAKLILPGYDIGRVYDLSAPGSTNNGAGLNNYGLVVFDSAYTDATSFATHMAGKTFLYELAEASEVDDEDPQPLTTVVGLNVLYHTQQAITGTTLEASYDTTSFNIDLDSTRSYYTKLSGAESIQTGLSTLAVDATQDKVMDLTLAYAENRPSTVDELKSRYPGVASLGDYDRGHFVHASGGVWTTGVWTQVVKNGDFADSSDWSTNTSFTVEDGVLAFNASTAWAIIRNSTRGMIPPHHKFYMQVSVKLSAECNDIWVGVMGGTNLSYPQYMKPKFNPSNTDWEVLEKIDTASSFGPAPVDQMTVGVARGTATVYEGLTVYLKNWMLIDLTALCGAGNEPATVDEAKAYCASIGHDLSEYQAYDTGTPLGGSVDLTGIELKGAGEGTACDTYDAETGKQTLKFATYSWPASGQWNTMNVGSTTRAGFSLWTLPVNGINGWYITDNAVFANKSVPATDRVSLEMGSSAGNNAIYIFWDSTSEAQMAHVPTAWFVDGDPTQPNVEGFKAWLSANPVNVVYQRQTSVTTIQQQHVTLQPGFNAFYQASLGTLAIHDVMTYLGTEWTLKLGSGRKYLYRHNGEDTMLTPSSNMDQPMVSGDKLVDLTWLFGKAANVPATLEDCYALYPHMRGDMPYCASKMMNFTGTALKTVGFNLWDGTYSARNTYLKNDGTTGISNGFNVTNFIRIVGGLQYEVSRVIGANSSICWYDIDQNFISGVNYNAASTVVARQAVAPDNACWAKFTVRDSEASICVLHLCWRGYRNYGTPGYAYEPYKESVRDMRVTDWFPDGLASEPVFGYYDELTQTKSIKRIYRKVLTGNETWKNPTANGSNRYFGITSSNLGATNRKTGSRMSVYCNIVPSCDGFGNFNNSVGHYGGCCWGNTKSSSDFMLMLPYEYYTTVTTVAQLQAFLKARYESGDPVVLQWPLATPVETDISEEIPQLSYNYEDFGLEEIIPPNEETPYTPPANLLIVYQKDFTRDVANLPENYISKESMADLNAQLGPALNGTISGEYNSATGKFEFTFTRNPTVAALTANASAPSLNIGMTYTQSPTVNVTYTLPTPSDLTQDNTIIVDVTCSNHTIAFSYNSTTIDVQKQIAPATGIKYRFICSYAFSAWKVFALEVT